MTVLVVDDNPDTLEATRMFLKTCGVNVVALPSPFGVTREVMRSNPNVVVLDVMMPGLSGSSLAVLIRKNCDAPIIFFSAMPEEDLRDLAAQTRRATYVLRSEGYRYLVDEIERLVSAPARPPESSNRS